MWPSCELAVPGSTQDRRPGRAQIIDECDVSPTLRLVDDAVTDGIARGLGHLIAEDDQLGGRLITLHGRRHVNFGSCSYLGLETDLRLKTAACDAVARFGVQFASSRAYVSCPPYAELERLLDALFEHAAGDRADHHAGPLRGPADPDRKQDAVICDQLVHASVQAVLPTLQAAGTVCRFVRHNRIDRLAEMVETLAARHRRVWYLADGIYSMHGDPAPLRRLRELPERNERFHLYLDDSHGARAGRASTGAGRCSAAIRCRPRTVVVASLAKAFAAGGAVLAFSDAETARLVRACGSTMIFSGPLQPRCSGRRHRLGAHPPLGRARGAPGAASRERIRLFNALWPRRACRSARRPLRRSGSSASASRRRPTGWRAR